MSLQCIQLRTLAFKSNTMILQFIKNDVVASSDILEGVFGNEFWEEIVFFVDHIRRLILFHSSTTLLAVKFMLHVHTEYRIIINYTISLNRPNPRVLWVPKLWPTAFLVSFIKYNIMSTI
jgi:hypothetical protein